MKKEIIDISLPISNNLPIWPGDPPLEITTEMSIKNGANANVSRINMSVHTGTHLDAPLHFFDDKPAIDDINLELFVGDATVILIKDHINRITHNDLQSLNIDVWPRRLLLKTNNSSKQLWKDNVFHTEFCALSADAAGFLVNKGVSVIGIDYLSIAPFDEPDPVHKILLGNGVVILEGLNLIDVSPGNYKLVCLPLKILDIEGAPARAILIKK